jgi:hypothetical protein
MQNRILQILICTLLVCWGASNTSAQTTVAEFQNLLKQKAAFDEVDFAALRRQEAVVRVLPVTDKREVAVSGLVSIRTGIDEFLQSYRESMTRKSNAAILEVGSFGKKPAFKDLQNLTIEPRDIDDLKHCVVGSCKVKLSAPMIERFRKEIDWQSSDYHVKATNLFKEMLVDYVRDYRERGEAALIEYNDARNEIRLAEEQRELAGASGYANELLNNRRAELRLIEEAIVWSKIELGLKPVIAINHITIYRRDGEVGPQAVIASRQIYANHYFNAALALTAFVSVPGAANEAFLVSENRSRADGLAGPFGRLKRVVIERRAVEGLRSILEHSKLRLEGADLNSAASEFSSPRTSGWGQRLFGGIRPLLWLLMLSALIALLALGRLRGEPLTQRRSKIFKPESAKS